MLKLQFYNQSKTLPWKPKVRRKELESFIDQERKKFLGYGDLTEDVDTLIGLPYPIHESVKVLKQHLYTSLSDEQIKLEEKLLKYPLSTKINEDLKAGITKDNQGSEPELSSTEILFSSLLSNLPQYLVRFVMSYFFKETVKCSKSYIIFLDMFVKNSFNFSPADKAKDRLVANNVGSVSRGSTWLSLLNN